MSHAFKINQNLYNPYQNNKYIQIQQKLRLKNFVFLCKIPKKTRFEFCMNDNLTKMSVIFLYLGEYLTFFLTNPLPWLSFRTGYWCWELQKWKMKNGKRSKYDFLFITFCVNSK